MRYILALVLMLNAAATVATPALSAEREQDLFKQLRCVVCEGQSLAESDAAIAIDMRNFITSQMKVGKTDQQIIDTLVGSYGETILMAPPVEGEHKIVWFLPIFLLLAGSLLLFKLLRNARS